jgi:hypothetical protein
VAISPEALVLARDAVDPEQDAGRWWIRPDSRWAGDPPADQPLVLLLAEIATRLASIEELLQDAASRDAGVD